VKCEWKRGVEGGGPYGEVSEKVKDQGRNLGRISDDSVREKKKEEAFTPKKG